MMHGLSARQGKRSRSLRWMAAAGLIFLAFLINEVVGSSGYVARRAQVQQIEELNQEIGRLRDENYHLTRRIQDLRSDPDAIEEMAREQLHLGKPGEVVVTLPPRQSSQP
jgi:cell division protein FtsB